ncbi:MAG: sigma-54 dependent transcriptional regulator [Spirochaetia bacterium]|nr:sigma-54 dependent transcriptional regulator [Spirochaetota bacterium]MCX8097096.1 sigma-54 dependent transcriptional regulator [Spirochaetota bacterium]MDW8112030.1 sigma-54 dependent transcriptional regulator [Spirochaetia bacterium]
MYKKTTILVVDDETEILVSINNILQEEFDVLVSRDFSLSLKILEEIQPDVALIDLKLGDRDGREIIKSIKERDLKTQIIVISAYTDIENIVDSIKLGAFDFVEKPISPARLKVAIKNALENLELRKLLENKILSEGITTQNPRMKEIIKLVEKSASTSFPVLILGESGTGKERIASLIHNLSKRRYKEFVKLNCSAIPSELFESELFGYEKGSFTGAYQSKKGKFEIANGGTLFLDEIGDLSLEHQAKLLRAIEYGEITKIGSKETIKVDVRIVSATNKDLERMVKEKAFREDLFYRINVITIHLPPLRERKEDIKILAEFFLKETIQKEGLPNKYLTDEAIHLLENYDYPGNVRELKNIIQRLVIVSEKEVITKEDVNKVIATTNLNRDYDKLVSILSSKLPPNTAREEFEKIYLKHHLEKNQNNVSKTALSLGILPNNLLRRLKELGLK